MPLYPGGGQATLLYETRGINLFNPENIAAGSFSIAAQLRRVRGGGAYPEGISLQVAFGGAPGTFEIDLLTSDTDAGTASYVQIAALTGNLNTNNQGRIELPSFWALFALVYLKTLTNPVTTFARLTR
jgi:hypothetical protein